MGADRRVQPGDSAVPDVEWLRRLSVYTTVSRLAVDGFFIFEDAPTTADDDDDDLHNHSFDSAAITALAHAIPSPDVAKHVDQPSRQLSSSAANSSRSSTAQDDQAAISANFDTA